MFQWVLGVDLFFTAASDDERTDPLICQRDSKKYDLQGMGLKYGTHTLDKGCANFGPQYCF